MSHFAKIVDGFVTEVIVADQEFVDTLDGVWVQTSYNTYGGVHKLGGVPLRKNFAGVGYAYDESLDAFIPPKPFPSWSLNETTGLWDAPTPMPDTGKIHLWDEENQTWTETAYDKVTP
jgi:hypothetical protein